MSQSEQTSGETTVTELRDWLRGWVQRATGLDPAAITDDRSLEEYGLSSRDAVSLSADLEDLLGRPLDATVAYQHPTIASLAEFVVNGPAPAEGPSDLHTFRGLAGGMEFDVAVVGLATRFPGGAATPEAMWELLDSGTDATGPRPHARSLGGDCGRTRGAPFAFAPKAHFAAPANWIPCTNTVAYDD